MSYIGKPASRVDGRAKVTGAAKYAAEYDAPGLAHGSVVTSSIAKGRVARVDAGEALRVAGVIGVLTHQNRPRMADNDQAYKEDVSPDGSLRVITSKDGDQWQSAALITSPTSDLRDAKITETPDGRLMLAGAEAVNNPTTHKHQSLVWFSGDGRNWSDRHEVGTPDNWLWRITWHNGVAYGFGYDTGDGQRGIRLFRSSDGRTFETLIEKADVTTKSIAPTELLTELQG